MRHETTRYFSLFSGIGGFEIGIERSVGAQCPNEESEPAKSQIQQRRKRATLEKGAGLLPSHIGRKRSVRCVGFSEIDPYATQIYQKHFPDHENYGDITAIDERSLPDFDLLVGGFPCQSFSIAGKRGGFNDTRGTLFFDIARIAKAKRPRLLLLENVKGLLSHDQGRTFFTIIATLDELGYDLQWQVLNSKDFGVPQNRERVLIVGHLRGTPRPEVFPFAGDGCEDARHSTGPQSGIAGTINRGEFKETGGIALNLPASYYKGHDNHGARPMVSDDLSIRRLTPLECERLQGFPDGWTEGLSDTQRYKCCGNAVTTNVIQAVAERLLQ